MTTKIAYLECPTGLAGDMCLGALVHAGVPLEYLIEKLSLLEIKNEYQLWAELVDRNGQQATKVHVDLLDVAPPEHEPPTFTVHVSDPSKSPSIHEHSHRHRHSHSRGHSHSEYHHYSEHYHHTHTPSSSKHEHEGKRGQGDGSDRTDSPDSPDRPDRPDRHRHPRHLPEIEALITAAKLPDRVEAWSLAVFRRLAAAEGAVHGISVEQVHFHEVGATDAIVDIVGTCLGLDWLAIDELYCSAIPVGGGTIHTAHGLLPVPAPAVLKLLEMRQVPIYSNGIARELVTPTGAAIVTTLSTQFGSPPAMTLQRVGLGAGSRNLVMPNILRLWLGSGDQERRSPRVIGREVGFEPLNQKQETRSIQNLDSNLDSEIQNSQPPSPETIAVLETQIDDLNPQAIGYLFDVLFAAGALDVFTQAIGMKKSRPGILLTVLCDPAQVAACESIIFRETTTLGIRQTQQRRSVLHRAFQTVNTPYGAVRLKIARREGNGTIVNIQPEYEDCAALARQHDVPWREIHRLALEQWYSSAEQNPQEPEIFSP
jgi:hypothetical protein